MTKNRYKLTSAKSLKMSFSGNIFWDLQIFNNPNILVLINRYRDCEHALCEVGILFRDIFKLISGITKRAIFLLTCPLWLWLAKKQGCSLSGIKPALCFIDLITKGLRRSPNRRAQPRRFSLLH